MVRAQYIHWVHTSIIFLSLHLDKNTQNARRDHLHDRSAPSHALCKTIAALFSSNARSLLQYSQAVRAGNYVYTSGSVGMTKDKKMVEGTVRVLKRKWPFFSVLPRHRCGAESVYRFRTEPARSSR